MKRIKIKRFLRKHLRVTYDRNGAHLQHDADRSIGIVQPV